MESIARYTKSLSDKRNEDLRTCMSKEGFPQLVEASELTARRTPSASLDPLRVDPLEAGPYTQDQARRLGMVGTVTLFAPSEPGTVVSRDPAYDAALRACESTFAQKAGSDVGALLGQSAELESSLRGQFLEVVEPGLTRLLTSRLQCVRETGYPKLDPARAVTADSFAAMLAAIGVVTGKVQTKPPAVPEPRPGEVVIVPPADPGTYRPGPEEVAFAETYVRCGESQGFTQRLKDLEDPVRTDLTEKNAVRLKALEGKLRAALRGVGA